MSGIKNELCRRDTNCIDLDAVIFGKVSYIKQCFMSFLPNLVVWSVITLPVETEQC